jgi:hypothetical protein
MIEEERDIEFDLAEDLKRPERDYLKYLRPIQKYFMKKHSLDAIELDMLLFLYSEIRFTPRRLKEMGYDGRKLKFLEERNYVKLWRKREIKADHIYRITILTKQIVSSFYDILECKKPIPLYKSNIAAYIEKKKGLGRAMTKSCVMEINSYVNEKEAAKHDEFTKKKRVRAKVIRKPKEKQLHRYSLKIISPLDVKDIIPQQRLRLPDE